MTAGVKWCIIHTMKLVKTPLTPPVCAISFVCAFALSVRAADLYVSTNGLHSIDGVVWGRYMTDDGVMHDAYTNLQQAVNAAAQDDTVWVENGFVCDDTNGSTGNPAMRLNVPKRMTVRGRSGSWEDGPVIRGRWHCDVAGGTSATGTEAVRGVYMAAGGNLIGFRIERCSQNGYSSIAFGNGTISNCFVSGCMGNYLTMSYANVRHCVISNCTAKTYASVSRYGSIYDSLIINCGSGGSGDSGAVLLSNNQVVSNCTFVGNMSVVRIVASEAGYSDKMPRAIDCVFSNNTATCIGATYGDGLTIAADRCLFVNNSGYCCTHSYNGNTYKNCRVIASDCVFSNNTMSVSGAANDFYNCLMVGNVSNEAVIYGFDNGMPARLFNCTLYGNTSRNVSVTRGNVVCVNTVIDATTQGKNVAKSVKCATNCCFEADMAVTEGENNKFEKSAGLFDPANGIFTPVEMSPCYGAGSLTAYELPATDLAGRPRLTDGKVAIGAFECDPKYRRLEVETAAPAYPHAPATYGLAAAPAGLGTTPRYYWDFDGDGLTDEITDVGTVRHVYSVGTWAPVVAVSNLLTGAGETAAFDPIVVINRPVRYVKDGNPDAAEPYDTEENAAPDIQTAVDYCANGDEIVVLPGTYNLTATIEINKDLIVHGSTGRPEDVIVNGRDSVRCVQLNGGGQAIVHSMTLTNGRASDTVFGGCLAINATGTKWSAGVGVASNLVARNVTCSTKFGHTHGIFAYGPNAFVTHCVISNCHSACGFIDGGNMIGIGLQVCGGAKAENCLVTGNYSQSNTLSLNLWEGAKWIEKDQKWDTGGYWSGNFQSAVLVGDDSVVRFCTVVGNNMSFCGGINVSGTGRFEDCVIAGNTLCCKSVKDLGERYKVWSAFPAGGISYSFRTPGNDNGKNRFYEIIAQEQAAAAEKGAVQSTNAVDAAEAGLGAGTIVATPEQLFRNAAKRDWRLRPSSPARDIVEPADAGAMAAGDLLGNPRLSNGLYDLGCFEAVFRGFGIFVR